MKQLTAILLLFVFAALLYLTGYDVEFQQSDYFNISNYYKDGMLKSEYNKVDISANYNFYVDFDPTKKRIFVKENIVWVNKTNLPTSEIQFHLYPNAYKSNKTLFAEAYAINSETQTQIDIKSFSVNGELSELIYFQPEIANPYDSTAAKVLLTKPIQPGDSVKIFFEYSMKIPRSVKRLGYATGRNFFFVSQWFPKVGVFEDGKWVCSQYHPYTDFYSNFGYYSVKIKIPKNYIVAAAGVEKEKAADQNSIIYHFVQSGVHDFAWLATDEIRSRTEIYSRLDGSQVLIKALVQPENAKYFERYFNAVKNSLKYFEENIGIYPYQTVTLVDVPRTSESSGNEIPTLFTIRTELFSSENTGEPEYSIIKAFAQQYFQGILANNEVYEAWLDEGFASYFAAKIMNQYHPGIIEHFKIASYLPVFGLNFLSFKGIPIIYTLVDVHITEGTRNITQYYRNIFVGTIADTSYKLPTHLSYIVNSNDKPVLVLHTLERYIGFEKMMKILREYYNQFKYKHPRGKDFISIVRQNCDEDMSWFFDEFYYSAKSFDYRVTSLKKTSAEEWEVVIERHGEGFFKNDIFLYTDKDTLCQKWEGNERWKAIKFKTKNKALAAEVDPLRKNLLDLNFSNNSYTIDENYLASLSLSFRWFFWVQNALVIMGSIG